MTKEKALYQVKLILDNLNKEEYDLIPKNYIEYINQNMEYDENIKIDPSVPIEQQDIDEKAYDYLEKIINETEKLKELYKTYDEYTRSDLILKIENYKKEQAKFKDAKIILEDYKNIMYQKDEQIKKLKESNNYLLNSIQKCPKIIRKIFFKEFNRKMLSE